MAEQFWFGTERHSEWVEVPQTGADMSSTPWVSERDFLSGRGAVRNSYMSSRDFQFTWAASSSRELAQKIKSYSDGIYGRGLIYFVDPLLYNTNTLPAHWADPSMAIDRGAAPVLIDWYPTGTATAVNDNDLPVVSALYDATDLTPGFDEAINNTVFIPKPEGYTLALGAFYSAPYYSGVYVTPVFLDGTEGEWIRLTELAVSETSNIVPDLFTDPLLAGVRLWVGKGYTNETNFVTNPSFETATGTVDTPYGVEPIPDGVFVSDMFSVSAWQDATAKLYGDYGLIFQWATDYLSLTTETGGLYSTDSSEPYDLQGFEEYGLYNVRPDGDLTPAGVGFYELGV